MCFGAVMFQSSMQEIDFTSPTLDPRITFTRSSGGTYWDASGTMQTAGNNTPRYDYDPVTLAFRGLLIEGQRTNLLLNSATLSTQSVAVTAQAYTLSFYGTGTVTLSGASTAGPLVGTGAKNQVSITFTPSAGTLTLTVSGSVTYANLEAGSGASSWIPTTGAAATRTADVATGASDSIRYNPAAVTLFAEFAFANGASTVNANARVAFSVGDNTNSNRIYIYNIGGAVGALVSNAGSTQAAPSVAGTAAVGIKVKTAIAAAKNNFISARGGSLSAADTSGLMPGGTITTFGIGQNSAGGNQLGGWVQRVRIYPGRLANAELQAMTT